MKDKIPMRTCIACRQEKPKREMLRIVKSAEGKIEIDFSGKLPGRGAYLCGDPQCVLKLKKNRLLNKNFSSDVKEEIYDRIEEEFLGQK